MSSTAEESASLVILRGRVDASTVAVLRDRLHAAVDSGAGRLVVDLADVDTIDVTALNMLIGARRRAQRAGRDLVLRAVPARVARLLRVTRLNRVLHEDTQPGVPVG